MPLHEHYASAGTQVPNAAKRIVPTGAHDAAVALEAASQIIVIVVLISHENYNNRT